MLKVLFYGYAMGERSSRVIAHRLKSDVAYMYLSALQQPDFRTINRFRKDNIGILKGLFVQIVRLCVEMGMVSVGMIAIDGTKLKVNASYRKTKKADGLDEEISVIDKQIESILKECEETDSREDEIMGEDKSIYEVTEELKDKQKLKEKLKRAKEKMLMSNSKEINITDDEATTMLHKGYPPEPSYNGQVAVEGSNGVIVAATLTNNPADYEALKELIEETEVNTRDKPSEVLADSGFSSYENLEYLEEKGIEGYIPDQKIESTRKGTYKHPEFHKSRFKYDGSSDSYICPMGKTLAYKGLMKREGKPDIRIYRCMDCPHCKRKAECTKAEYRTISWDPREFLIHKMCTRLETKEGKIKYGKRKYLIEPVFGDMKYNRNMRGLLLRGKLKAAGEFLIMCIAHNLRKVAKYLIGSNYPVLGPIMV
ncbi:MAG: IS1182 family transposase [Thermodesulfovibrionales bacterium]|nr:IS1182 family transposase [Thermodesulfovibrionales bacterium]